MQRSPSLALAALAAAAVAPAQTTPTLLSEPFGTACGIELTHRHAGTHPGGELAVTSATPHAPLALLLGTRPADVALPGSGCRLLTAPMLALPLRTDDRGRTTLTLPVPAMTGGSFYGQVLALDPRGQIRGSAGQAFHALPVEDIHAAVLARVDLPDGTRVQFLQPEPGELLVVARGVDAAPPQLRDYGNGDLSAVALYESLRGAAAPPALRDAQRAARDAAAGEAPIGEAAPRAAANPDRVADGRAVVMAASSCMSASWFTSNHCGSSSGYEYCWTNLTGNPWVQRRCLLMWGVTACVSGSYVFEYRRRSLSGNWSTSYSTTVTSCQWFWASGSGNRRYRRMHVKYGTGDLKHFSVRGLN